MLSVDFLIWVVLLRNQLMSGGFCPLKSKLGGYAPEWVAMLRNRAAPEGRFGGKITTLGGFAPENSTVPKPPKLGGHAPEHPLENFRRLCCNYERYLTSARAMTYIACILFMLRYI